MTSSQFVAFDELREQHLNTHPTDQSSRSEEPKYTPPYDSPIEDDFAYHIVKYLNANVIFQKQVSATTACGRFRMDFTARQSDRTVGLECDGEVFHNNKNYCSARDRWRDSLILATGAVEVIYRFTGKNLVYNMNDCLFILAAYEPQLFSERGLVNLTVLASDEVKNQLSQIKEHNTKESFFCGYKEFQYQYGISVYRHHHTNSFLLEKSAFAKQIGGTDLDHIMQQFENQRAAINKMPGSSMTKPSNGSW